MINHILGPVSGGANALCQHGQCQGVYIAVLHAENEINKNCFCSFGGQGLSIQ